MRPIFNRYYIWAISVVFTSLLTIGSAQQALPLFGFVRIVNAVGHGEGNAKFSLDQEDIYPAGYEMGQDCGGMSVNQGIHSITVSKNGVGKGTTKVDVVTGETITLIAFADLIPPLKKDDPPTWTIKLLKLKQKDVDKGYGLTLISVADAPEIPITLGSGGKEATENFTLVRLKFTYVSLGANRRDVMVKKGKNNLTMVSPDMPGNYIVVIYQGEKDELRSIYFFDPKFTTAG